MDGNDSKDGAKRRTSAWRRLLKALVVVSLSLVAALVVLALSAPYILPLVPIPELAFDLSPYLEGKAAGMFREKTATAKLSVQRGHAGGLHVLASGKILGWPYSASANVDLHLLDGAEGDLELSLDGTDWRLAADFAGKSARVWRFGASVAERPVSQDDAVIAAVLSSAGLHSVSNLAFSGRFSLEASGSSSKSRPVPAWKVRGAVRDLDADVVTADGNAFAARNLRVKFGADGIADHVDIQPLFPRADSIEAAGLTLSNAFASVRATERSYLVTEAGADCCGGELKLYSLFLDPERLNAGATVFVDGIEAGAALSRISGFRGEASGRLYGKLPFYLKDGRDLHLKNAYLFSRPGEIGNVRIEDAQPILDNLALGGVSEDVRDNLSKALANLDYNVLKIELVRGEGGESSALALKLEGSATRGGTTVPVKLDVTFYGDLDQLVNTGMKISRRAK